MANRSLSVRGRLHALLSQGKPPAGIEPASHSGSGKEGDPRAALRLFPRCHLFTFKYYQYKAYTQAFVEIIFRYGSPESTPTTSSRADISLPTPATRPLAKTHHRASPCHSSLCVLRSVSKPFWVTLRELVNIPLQNALQSIPEPFRRNREIPSNIPQFLRKMLSVQRVPLEHRFFHDVDTLPRLSAEPHDTIEQ